MRVERSRPRLLAIAKIAVVGKNGSQSSAEETGRSVTNDYERKGIKAKSEARAEGKLKRVKENEHQWRAGISRLRAANSSTALTCSRVTSNCSITS
jgi:hypothetical protein